MGGAVETYRTQNTQFLVFSLKMARKKSSKCSSFVGYLQYLCYNEEKKCTSYRTCFINRSAPDKQVKTANPPFHIREAGLFCFLK